MLINPNWVVQEARTFKPLGHLITLLCIIFPTRCHLESTLKKPHRQIQRVRNRFLPMANMNLSMSEYTIAKPTSEVFHSYNLADYLDSDLK
jgi:hypothetical protein